MDRESSPQCQLVEHFFSHEKRHQQTLLIFQVQLQKALIVSSEVRRLVEIAQVSFTLQFILWQMVGRGKVKILSVIHALSNHGEGFLKSEEFYIF